MKRSALLTRSLRKNYPVAVHGEGVYLYDADEKRYLDFSGSAAVNFIGHGDRRVNEAITAQLGQIEFVHSSQFVTPVAQQFAEEVIAFAGPHFSGGSVFFTSGGSEAVETALKLARQYQVEIGQRQRVESISRRQSYHGATFGAMSVSGNRKRKEIYEPLLRQCEQVNTPYCYRCYYGHLDCAERYAHEVEELLLRAGHETSAFIFEPVSGATLGAAVPPNGYLERVVAACHEHGVLVIADEVMTGFGRTGRNFAMEHFNLVPDIIVCAKGIASGYAPLGAVIAGPKIIDAISRGSGALVHGFTYNAHPVALAAGSSVLKIIRDRDLVAGANSEAADSTGSAIKTDLKGLLDCPVVGDVRGLGLLWGIEFVTDKATKSAFPPALQFSSRVATAAAKRGVLTYPMQGSIDGECGDHLLLAPPAIITHEQITWAVDQLAQSIYETQREVSHQ